MKFLQQGLSSIYKNDQVPKMLNSIEELIAKYRSKTDSKPHFKLSEKDVVLITYGDQVYKNGENKLVCLNKILRPYLSDAISIVHILPFYPYSSDDGFSVIDYYAVDPGLGSWKDIESLSEGFDLLFDAVINHTSSKSEWFKKYLDNDAGYKNYYVDVENTDGYDRVVRPRVSPLFHTFEAKDGKRNVWTTFSKDQVDLNFKNPKVFLQIIDLLLFYISEGAKIIRLDAVGFMWKQKNTNCLHLPQTHQLIKLMRHVIKKVDDTVLILTETNVPHEENISYFGNGNEADMVYNFTLPPLLAYALLSKNTIKLTHWAKNLKIPYPNVCFFNFLASHDGIGVRPVDNILSEDELDLLIKTAKTNGGQVSYKSNPDGSKTPYEINCNYLSLLQGESRNREQGIKRSVLAHAILLAMPGLPAIYFHSLFGSKNDVEGMKKSGIPRRVNRQKLNIDELIESVNDPKSRRHRILFSIKKLLLVRKPQPAFNPYAPFTIENCGKDIFNITRISPDGLEKILTYYNFSESTKEVKLEKGKLFTNLLDPGNTRDKITLKPLGFVWLKQVV